MSQVALPGSSTTTSPGTSRREDTALLTDRHHQCPFFSAEGTEQLAATYIP